MTELQIQYFLTVAQEKSVSKAAEALYVSQPAVSKQLMQLEEELGVPLFTRQPHHMEITEAGIAFEKLFLEFHSRFHETLETAKSSARKAKRDYYMGCLDGWDISAFCPELLDYMERRYPELCLHVTSCDIDRIRYALRRGEVDSVITTASLFEGVEDIQVDTIATVDTVLLFSARHPLARKENLKLADFRDSPFYITAPQGMRNALDDLIFVCRQAGFMPKIEYVPTLSAAYMKMHMGRGVFLTNSWIMSKNNSAFCTLLLNFKRRIGIASLAGRLSPFHDEIKNDIVDFFTRSGEADADPV